MRWLEWLISTILTFLVILIGATVIAVSIPIGAHHPGHESEQMTYPQRCDWPF